MVGTGTEPCEPRLRAEGHGRGQLHAVVDDLGEPGRLRGPRREVDAQHTGTLGFQRRGEGVGPCHRDAGVPTRCGQPEQQGLARLTGFEDRRSQGLGLVGGRRLRQHRDKFAAGGADVARTADVEVGGVDGHGGGEPEQQGGDGDGRADTRPRRHDARREPGEQGTDEHDRGGDREQHQPPAFDHVESLDHPQGRASPAVRGTSTCRCHHRPTLPRWLSAEVEAAPSLRCTTG